MRKTIIISIFFILLLGFLFQFQKETTIEMDIYPIEWKDNGIFQSEYNRAYQKLQELTFDEKIGQLFLVRVPEENQLEDLQFFKFGGYLFFERDFKNLTKEEVKAKITAMKNISKIPLLTAVDEEGGKIVRISSNPNLVNERFLGSSELYQKGGFEEIKKDTINKSNILYELGINLNLAPVVDVSLNENDYMYERSFKENSQLTSIYAQTVIEASDPKKVSYTLKHFPGYGNNLDTHKETSKDNRTLESLKVIDLPPFEKGISSGAEAILISHNIVTAIDSLNPASLSLKVHELLRNDLKFTGIIITDNLDMAGLNNEEEIIKKAIVSGNDLLITTNYKHDIETLKKLLKSNIITEKDINHKVFRILAWKYYKGLFS